MWRAEVKKRQSAHTCAMNDEQSRGKEGLIYTIITESKKKKRVENSVTYIKILNGVSNRNAET